MKKELKYRKAIFCVLYIKDEEKIEYLLFRRKKHWKGWEFCKGGCEKETLKQCVVREVKEETGQKVIDIKKYKKNGRFRYEKELSDRPGVIGQTYTLFSGRLRNKKVKIDKKEHFSYKWMSFDKAIKILTWPNQRACLRIVNKKLK